MIVVARIDEYVKRLLWDLTSDKIYYDKVEVVKQYSDTELNTR